jgi:hypothetical protein
MMAGWLPMLPLVGTITDMWYALPLLVSISLVYSATRHERMRPILVGAGWFATWIVVFMAGAMAVLYFLSSRL